MAHSVAVQAIIQARACSTRLPKKIFEPIGEKSLLGWVVERLRRAKLVDRIIIATSTAPDDDHVELFANREGLGVFRGSEEDVLDRFYYAMERYLSDIVIRATGDNPLVHPPLVDDMVREHISRSSDYTGVEGTIPLGSAVEIVSPGALATAWREAADRAFREHVTPFIYSRPERFSIHAVQAPAPLAGRAYRFTVDTAQDLSLMRAIHAKLVGQGKPFDTVNAVELLENAPELLEINRDVKQKDWRAELDEG